VKAKRSHASATQKLQSTTSADFEETVSSTGKAICTVITQKLEYKLLDLLLEPGNLTRFKLLSSFSKVITRTQTLTGNALLASSFGKNLCPDMTTQLLTVESFRE